MKISTKGKKSPNVTNLNPWGGAVNNEQPQAANRGFAGKTPTIYGGDLSNEQTANGKYFKGFSPNRSGIDYRLGGQSDGNENPKGFKQDAKPKAYKPSGV
jgi:hypothetical protein